MRILEAAWVGRDFVQKISFTAKGMPHNLPLLVVLINLSQCFAFYKASSAVVRQKAFSFWLDSIFAR